MGLVLFSGAAFIQFPLTFDHSTAHDFPGKTRIRGSSPDRAPLSAEPIDAAVRGFDDKRPSQKVLVVLTDGEDHEGDPVAAAARAADSGVIVYYSGTGFHPPASPSPTPTTSNGATRLPARPPGTDRALQTGRDHPAGDRAGRQRPLLLCKLGSQPGRRSGGGDQRPPDGQRRERVRGQPNREVPDLPVRHAAGTPGVRGHPPTGPDRGFRPAAPTGSTRYDW